MASYHLIINKKVGAGESLSVKWLFQEQMHGCQNAKILLGSAKLVWEGEKEEEEKEKEW